MRARALVLAVAIVLAPLGAQAADLVVWWEKAYYAQEDEAVREIIGAFEHKTGKQIELIQPTQGEFFDKAQAVVEAGKPPDFMFGTFAGHRMYRWGLDDRLVDMEETLGFLLNLFDVDAIEKVTLLNGRTGRYGVYALPMGRASNHLHVWKSLLERAGFTLADIPKEWGAFWSFWCDQVQPAVRKALGRDDVWAVGLPMSAAAPDTSDELLQFQLAYQAAWLSNDGQLQVNDPKVRDRLIEALEAYAAIWRKGCTPPQSAGWSNIDNNKAFLAQLVLMTPNLTLAIPAALRTARPDDYYANAATIDWPNGADGQPLTILGFVSRAVVFKGGVNPQLAAEFVRFLIEDGWLAHWLDFAGDRLLPPMRKLVEQPLWLDTSDPHRMRAAIQILTLPHHTAFFVRGKEIQTGRINRENVWGKAVHRVAAEGISAEQAVDEAIARIKQILSE